MRSLLFCRAKDSEQSAGFRSVQRDWQQRLLVLGGTGLDGAGSTLGALKRQEGIVLARWLAKRWGRKQAAGPRDSGTSFAVESLEPRLLLSGVLGNEEPYALPSDIGLAPLAAIQIDTLAQDATADTLLQGLSISPSPSISVEVQGDVEGSGSVEVLDGQPVEPGILLDQLAALSLSS